MVLTLLVHTDFSNSIILGKSQFKLYLLGSSPPVHRPQSKVLSRRYLEQVNTDPGDVELNVDSLKAYVEKSNAVAHWTSFIEKLGVAIGPVGMISRDVQMAKAAGLTRIGEIDSLLSGGRKWGEPYLREFFHNTFGDPDPKRHVLDRNGVITIFLIGEFQNVFTDEALDRQFGWGKPERATVPARKFNPKA